MSRIIWLPRQAVLDMHAKLIATHSDTSPGLRDEGLLNSALNRPRDHLEYNQTSDICTLAALYGSAIIRNHPFIDGNKRTGITASAAFLENNGLYLTAPESSTASTVFELAAGGKNAQDFAAWLRVNTARNLPRR